MKNLKKLSVVLFATLLSLNFTSCIDDGVSDAVDQVYLAQAEFLKAQAALKEADAQKVLAEAAYEQARAAMELANAAGKDALTAYQLLVNEGQVETNALNAQKNVIFLAEETAKLDVALQLQMNLLQAAISAYDVAMVNLGEAVAQAKDALVLEYYADYSTVVSELNTLYEQKINDEHDLALKELMLTSLSGSTATNPTDLVARAYYQAMLEADLAESEASLVAKQTALATAQAITADDASDPQKLVTDLYNQAQAIIATNNQLRVDLAEAMVATDQALEAWDASTAKYDDLMDAEDLLTQAIAAKKEHTDAIVTAEDAILAAQANIDALPALEDAVVTVAADTLTALTAIADAKQLIEDKEGLRDDAVQAWNDAEDAYDDAKKLSDAASFFLVNSTVDVNALNMGVGFGFYPRIVNAEIAYMAMTTALAAPVLDVATATTNNDAAQAAEVTAQGIWTADPTGNTTTDTDGNHSDFYYGTEDFDLGEIGIDTDLSGDTYMRVATWIEYPAPGSGDYRPATFEATQYNSADLTVAAAALIADAGNGIGSNADIWLWEDDDAPSQMRLTDLDLNLVDGNGDATNTGDEHFINAANAGNAALDNIAVFVNVERDDNSESNFDILMAARIDAENTEYQLGLATGEIDNLMADLADATALVTKAYAAYGFTFPDSNGITLLSDWQYIQDYRDGLIALTADAYEAWNNSGTAYMAAQGYGGAIPANTYTAADKASTLGGVYDAELAVLEAIADLGTEFRPMDDDKAWNTRFSLWYDLYEAQVTANTDVIPTNGVYTVSAYYQQLQDEVADGVTEFVRYARWEDPTAYQELENAYYAIVWAMEDVEASKQTEYDLLYDIPGVALAAGGAILWDNATVLAAAAWDIAKLEALLPSHDFAIDYLQGEFDRLAALYNLDLTLWDLEGGHGLGMMLMDLPLYAVYLDALEVETVLQAEIDANFALRMDIIQIRQAVVDNLVDDVAIRNVALFLEDIADQIDTLETDIATLEDNIEIEKGLVSTGIVDTETAEAWIVECERQLAQLDTKITGFETAAASLLARINALMN